MLFCDICEDKLEIGRVIFAYGKKFCSKYCCKSFKEADDRFHKAVKREIEYEEYSEKGNDND